MQGTVIWNELMTSDVEAAKAFYAETLGWSYQPMDMPDGTYWIFQPGGADKPAGGIMGMPKGGEAPTDSWFTYFEVDDVDAAVSRCTAAGGMVMRPPFHVPTVGRIAIVADRTGAAMGWIQPEPMS